MKSQFQRATGWSRGASLIMCCWFGLPCFVFTPISAQELSAERAQVSETIVVTGRRPGPRLWKVSNGENALWILAYQSPLPKRFVWDSDRVEEVLNQSQAYLPMFDPSPPVRIPPALLALPEGQSFEQMIPPGIYSRYVQFREEYLDSGRNTRNLIENVRPLLASSILVQRMFEKHDLADGGDVLERIERLARRSNVNRIEFAVDWATETAEHVQAELIDAIRAVTLDYELECFENVLADTRPAIDLIIRRANAWAEGDARTLSFLYDPRRRLELPSGEECGVDVTGRQFVERLTNQAAGEFVLEMRNLWLAEAERALDENASSFAVLGIAELLRNDEDSFLSMLAEKGYSVERPL